ncbi:MAG: transglutaminase family protein [Gluconacetobacter diazotrophicus]|nr:transglutaminase family protein [Gluconacetobacter diazotrophicus]
MADAGEALAAIGMLPDAEIDPAPAALQLARLDDEGGAWLRAADHLSELARDSARLGTVLSGRSAEIRIGALAGLIHARHGYRGDAESYDDLDNANLIRVIERRRGLPVALGVIWLHCLRAAGWEGHGIDFPGHFLLSLAGPPGRSRQPRRLLVDPFDDGAVVGSPQLLPMLERIGLDADALRPGMLKPMTMRGVLLRLQRNLVSRRLSSGEPEPALRSLEGMLLIAPDVLNNWLDAAELHRGLGRPGQARRCLEHVLEAAPDTEAARIAQQRLEALGSGGS